MTANFIYMKINPDFFGILANQPLPFNTILKFMKKSLKQKERKDLSWIYGKSTYDQ